MILWLGVAEMNNNELLVALKEVFEKKFDEVSGALVEDLRGDIKSVAKGIVF